MRNLLSPLLLSTFLCATTSTSTATPSNTTHLVLPALITTPTNTTAIQFWRLFFPLLTSTTPGTLNTQVSLLSNTTSLSYSILPPRYNGSLHTAPAPQFVHFVSGLAHITVRGDGGENGELWILGGRGGGLIAADTEGEGHVSTYPEDKETVAIVAPFEGGRVPGHEVVREGPCEGLQTLV